MRSRIQIIRIFFKTAVSPSGVGLTVDCRLCGAELRAVVVPEKGFLICLRCDRPDDLDVYIHKHFPRRGMLASLDVLLHIIKSNPREFGRLTFDLEEFLEK